ncbi:MAG: DNA primase [Candidatus Omnitrophica bacterium]|nr:DNA primase [Candidatus Omnitrophota bacterium]
MIPQNFIEEVQSRTDIVELISSYIPLKRTGRNFKALCPFHGEKTPSFIISPQKQIFHCFGCGEGGGVFHFLSLIEKVTFPESVEILAKRLGLSLPAEKGAPAKLKSILYEASNEASLFFHDNLKNNSYCKPVLQHLKERGIAEKTIDTFRLGAALSGNYLMEHLRKKGFRLEALEKASLIIPKKDGYRDLFSDRIIFPIFDVRSRVVGFGARTWREDRNAPKYINSLEGILYHKRDHLFGLNHTKDFISQEDSVLITEGYLDMITPFMRGVKNIVASLGTALTLEQIRLIKRYTSNVILVFDSDKAGQNATLRSIDLLLENDMKACVASLPKGFDPDSLIRSQGIASFNKCLEQKRDFFNHKLALLKSEHEPKSIEGKTKIAQSMLATINKLQSEIKKYEYIKNLSFELDVKEEILIAEFKKMFKDNNRQKNTALSYDSSKLNSRVQKKEPIPITEKIILKFMFTNQKAFILIKDNLKERDFTSSFSRKAITYFFNNHPLAGEESIAKTIARIDDKEVSGFVCEILMDEDIPEDKNVFKKSLLKLKKRHTQEFKDSLRDEMRLAQIQGDSQRLTELINEFSRLGLKENQ